MKITEGLKLKGKYKFTKAFLETAEHWALNDRAKDLEAQALAAFDSGDFVKSNELQGAALKLYRKLNEICRTEITEVENLIPDAARAAIANWLTNVSPSPASLRLNYTSLGTGVTAPANSDTQLQTETYRKLIFSATNLSNVMYLTAAYAASEPGAGAVTYKEAGIFMNGAAGLNTGTLFSRVAINIAKDNTTTLTIDYTVTIN